MFCSFAYIPVLGKGFGWTFILNIVLTLLGYIPGLIHTFWVQTRN
ncbi:YqaE/Pmp3 family membrane protein [Klebsiella huaxiensis]